MPALNMVEAVRLALREEMRRDESVIVMGEDVGKNGGVFRTTEGLFYEFGEERVFDTPLSENGIMGTAVGLAINGFRPVAEIQFMGFIYYVLNHLICHAARLRNRTRGKLSVPMVLRAPYGAGIRAPEHHSESTEALFAHIPGIKVVVPSSPVDAKGLLKSAVRDPDPVVFLEPKKIYRAVKEEVPDIEYLIPLGKAKVVREGKDLTIICWGAMVKVAEEVALKAQAEKVDVEIIDIRTLYPMDRGAVIGSVEKTGRALVVHEAPKTGGLGAEIAAVINEKALLRLKAPVLRVTGQDITVPMPKAEDYYIPNAERVLRSIRKIMSF